MAPRPQHVGLSTRQLSILIGTICGDGNLRINTKRREKNARLQLSHATRLREYLQWKITELSCLFSSDRINDTRAELGELHASSRAFVELTYLYDEFYGSGEKLYTRQLLDRIDDLALAVWFMDDGTVDNNRHIPAPRMILTDLRNGQLELVSDWFESIGLFHTICREREDSSRELYFCEPYNVLFWKRITPHVPACMNYKLGRVRAKSVA